MRTDPATPPELPAACPSCGAAVRSTVPWCGQCFASLAPATEPAREPAREEPAAAPLDGPEAERARLDAVADQLLGELAAHQPPVFGSRLPASRLARVGVLAAGGLCGCALLVGLMAAVGLFL